MGLLSGAAAGSQGAAPSGSVPAFLDARDSVRVALPEPVPLESLAGKFTLVTRSGSIAVSEVRPGSDSVRDRTKPRTLGRVVLAGTLQAALGGSEWDPDGETTQMTEVRPGVHELVVALPAGRYEYKVARNGSWSENYGAGFEPGGQNLVLDVPKDGTVVRFIVDFNTRTIRNSIGDPAEVPAPASAPPPTLKPAGKVKYDVAVLHLSKPIGLADVCAPMTLQERGGEDRPVFARDVLSDPAFLYPRDDLGARWTRVATTFKVWSPVSASAEVLLFDSPEATTPRIVPMHRGTAGVWYIRVRGDLHGKYYRYRFHSHGGTREAADIYSTAATADARLSMVVDMKRTVPPGWPGPALPRRSATTDVVLYELHVRDFTVLPSSGVRPAWRGKYLGLIQQGTHAPGGSGPTGLDYLKGLGVTDIHVLPIQSTVTIANGNYGWGYATTLFNVPEEGYSTTPEDPVNVIREAKQMVEGLHRAGLRVVMDVVYNHTWPPDGADSAFQQTVPYFYFRTNDRGDLLNESGVGNAMADERPMVRKFIRESLLYWVREYNVDGFRFDLLGMHAPESVKDWARALHRQRPDVLIYGEPWTGGGPTRFPKGAQRGTSVAVFNDTFRSIFRGDTDGAAPGFAMGAPTPQDRLRLVLAGSAAESGGFTSSPGETINYVSAHDNLTLWDKVRRAMPDAQPSDHTRAVKLASASVLLSQGIPFLEGGVEIGRTKGGSHNSYNQGDPVNAYHWENSPDFRDMHAYVRRLIALRAKLPALRLSDATAIRRSMRFLDESTLPPNTIAWTLPGGPDTGWTDILIVLHGGREEASLSLPEGTWSVLADESSAGITPLRTVTAALPLAPLSAFVLAR